MGRKLLISALKLNVGFLLANHRLDLGGGGTIAKYVANRGIPVLDIGVPVLSMHSPFEVIHKTDLYMAYRTFSVFCQSAD